MKTNVKLVISLSLTIDELSKLLIESFRLQRFVSGFLIKKKKRAVNFHWWLFGNGGDVWS